MSSSHCKEHKPVAGISSDDFPRRCNARARDTGCLGAPGRRLGFKARRWSAAPADLDAPGQRRLRIGVCGLGASLQFPIARLQRPHDIGIETGSRFGRHPLHGFIQWQPRRY